MPKFRKIYSQNFSQSRKNLILGLNPPFWGLIRGFTALKKGPMIFPDPNSSVF